MKPDPLERQLTSLRPHALSPTARARLRQAIAALPAEDARPQISISARRRWSWAPAHMAAAMLVAALTVAIATTQSSATPVQPTDAVVHLRARLIPRHAADCEALAYDGLRRPVIRAPRLWRSDDS